MKGSEGASPAPGVTESGAVGVNSAAAEGSTREARGRGQPEWVRTRMLHFIRHGQYFNDGSGEGGLTPLGRKQAQRIAKHFERLPIVAVDCSDAPRAIETADILAKRLGMPAPRQHPLLREVLPSPIPGMDIPLEKRTEDRARLEQIFAHFFQASRQEGHDIVVCHGNLIRSLVLRIAAGNPDGYHQLTMHHGGVTSFAVSERGVTVIGFNVLEHMPLTMRTER